MRVWSLTCDTDTGLSTDLYLTERDAFEALARDWFGGQKDKAEFNSLMAAIQISADAAREWMTAWFERSYSIDNYVITPHDHPWLFPPCTTLLDAGLGGSCDPCEQPGCQGEALHCATAVRK